jgi:hypothetical protein
MVIEDLKKLFLEKEYRLILILTIWLIIGFTLFSFIQYFPEDIALAIFRPLLAFCFAFFVISLVTRKDLRELNWKWLLLAVGIGVAIAFLFTGVWRFIVGFLYRFGIISYVFITAIFYMYACYKYAFKADEKAYDLEKPKNHLLRWTMFIGGTLVALFLTRLIAIIGVRWARRSPEIVNGIGLIAIIIYWIIIALAIIGVLTLIVKRLNSWLGVFFLLVTLFTAYLMFNAFYALGSSGDTTYDLWMQIGLYLFDLGLIIYTISTIIGEKSEKISEKLKIMKVDAIIMWLIFSKAAYEVAVVADPNIPADLINAVLGFLLFIPLLAIAGIYGIINYGKIKKEKESIQNQ